MTDPSPATGSTASAAPAKGVAGGLLPDYNRAAASYWWLLVLAGSIALGWSVFVLTTLESDEVWQIVAGSVIAAVAGMFPLRVPKTKTSFASGDIFIFLLLLLHGPFAAVIAAAAEAATCAWRTSRRWSSRIVGPASAALAMLICGHLFSGLMIGLRALGADGEGVVLGAMLVFAIAYFFVSPTLVTTVIYLKRRRAPLLGEWLSTFGWLGMGYLASASIAGVLHLAFRQFGLTTMMVAVPMIGMFVTSLRVYFAQQEASEREVAEQASRERAETAEREAAMAAQHLHELELSDRRFQSAFAHAAIGMALVSNRGRLVQVNPAMCSLLGRDAADLADAPFAKCIDAEVVRDFELQTSRLRAGEVDSFRCEVRFRHALGQEVWGSLHCSYFAQDATSEPHLIVQAYDVTARRQAESRLQHLAFHDSLTGLPNRSFLHDSVALAIETHCADPAQPFSVLHLGFDRFKHLSDSFGHGAADEFLVTLASQIQAMMRPTDVLARLNGDDFGILALHRGGGTHHAIALAERLLKAFVVPIMVKDSLVHSNVSIGIAFSDGNYSDADNAMRDADLAMSKAKADGKSRYALFDVSLHARASDRLLLETDLHRALECNQLTLAYQPVFGIEPLQIVGFEALARWPHPKRGMVSPADFIPVAEESGQITHLTRWALREACRQLTDWRVRFAVADNMFVNVNIAGQDLCEPGFAEFVQDMLTRHELPASSLTLEITETALMEQLEIGSRTLVQLRELGIGLSVDDFGTGYSSLSHLSTLPINSLKIDRSFVDKLDGVSVESEIVRAVIQLGHALGKRVVAEGIETAGQLDRLRALGCGYAQGFLLARPMASAQIDALLQQAPAPVATRNDVKASADDAKSAAGPTANQRAPAQVFAGPRAAKIVRAA